MSISGLLNSLWNSKNVVNKTNISNISNNPPLMRGTQGLQAQKNTQDIYSQTNINNSVPISQGKEYMLYKQSKVNTVNNEISSFNENQNTNSKCNYNTNYNASYNSKSIIEGFDGMIGPSQVNIKNQTDSSNLQNMEDEFNRSISSYATTHKNLMDKSQQFLQGKRTYGKNIHAIKAANTDDIIPNWVGCYKPGNDGLTEQTDLGNNASLTDCKVRASDLGYSTFALRQKGASPGNTCFVGDNIDKAQSGGLATKSVLSYSFKKAEGANTGGLMMNGQIAMYEDDITNNLVTDLNAVANCDISIGGKINANTSVATYGYNCNGTEQSPFTAPPPQQAPEIPTPAGYTKYTNKDSGGNDIIKMADGTSMADLAAACDRNSNCAGFNSGGWIKSIIKPQSEWNSVNWNGKQLDIYVKNKNTINIDTSKQYRLQAINSSNCLYNNSDGRFNTYQCIDFNDQYWIVSEVPGQTNTFMFKSVNSQYSLYADTNGKFSTAVSDINNPTQQWELIPISGQSDTYQLKNKKTSTCLYNNADGRFNMSGCVAAYNDQWWKLIPISSGPKSCDQYSATDTQISLKCVQQLWKEVGCTADSPPQGSINWYTEKVTSIWPMTKSAIKADMEVIASNKNGPCYAPAPVVKTGSTINTGSLWSKPWTAITDGTNANSLSQLNDGTIICTNSTGYVYTRANISSAWTQISGGPTTVANSTTISSAWDGGYPLSSPPWGKPKCLDQAGGNKSSGVQAQIMDCNGGANQVYVYNESNQSITGPGGLCLDVWGAGTSNGTPVSQYGCHGGPNQRWVYAADKTLRPQHAPNKCLDALAYNSSYGREAPQIGIWDCNGYPNQTWSINKITNPVILMKGVIQLSNGTYIGIGQDGAVRRKTSLTAAWSSPQVYGLISITQLNDGTLIAVGLDNNLYKSRDVSPDVSWRKITCPQSCCVTFISTLNDGSIVGVGTNGYIYTRKTIDSIWVLVDSSMQMSSVTQLKDGTILGTSQSGNFFRK